MTRLSQVIICAYSLCGACIRPAFSQSVSPETKFSPGANLVGNPYLDAVVEQASEATLREYDLQEWIYGELVYLEPIEHHLHKEPRKKTEARYWELAGVIAHVAFNRPPIFEDDPTHAKTAALLGSIAAWEGHMVARVMRCEAIGLGGGLGPYQYSNGKQKEKVCSSYEGATEQAYDDARYSFAVCRKMPLGDRLYLYTGTWQTGPNPCRSPSIPSRQRVGSALDWWRKNPADFLND